jgi:hypothetical protein
MCISSHKRGDKEVGSEEDEVVTEVGEVEEAGSVDETKDGAISANTEEEGVEGGMVAEDTGKVGSGIEGEICTLGDFVEGKGEEAEETGLARATRVLCFCGILK